MKARGQHNKCGRPPSNTLHCTTSTLTITLTFDLITGTPITPVMWKVCTNLEFSLLFVFKLGGCTGQTDRQEEEDFVHKRLSLLCGSSSTSGASSR